METTFQFPLQSEQNTNPVSPNTNEGEKRNPFPKRNERGENFGEKVLPLSWKLAFPKIFSREQLFRSLTCAQWVKRRKSERGRRRKSVRCWARCDMAIFNSLSHSFYFEWNRRRCVSVSVCVWCGITLCLRLRSCYCCCYRAISMPVDNIILLLFRCRRLIW